VDEIQIFDGRRPSKVALKPNTYLIVISREHVYLSSRLAATFHSKSSLAAQAVYLNSTTGDPNWCGRLVFSLYNASGIDVELDLDATFATMVVHEAKPPSVLLPKQSKAVVERYLSGLRGDLGRIVGYILRDDDYSGAFQAKVDVAKRRSRL